MVSATSMSATLELLQRTLQSSDGIEVDRARRGGDRIEIQRIEL